MSHCGADVYLYFHLFAGGFSVEQYKWVEKYAHHIKIITAPHVDLIKYDYLVEKPYLTRNKPVIEIENWLDWRSSFSKHGLYLGESCVDYYNKPDDSDIVVYVKQSKEEKKEFREKLQKLMHANFEEYLTSYSYGKSPVNIGLLETKRQKIKDMGGLPALFKGTMLEKEYVVVTWGERCVSF